MGAVGELWLLTISLSVLCHMEAADLSRINTVSFIIKVILNIYIFFIISDEAASALTIKSFLWLSLPQMNRFNLID